jgi:hypothetical protein
MPNVGRRRWGVRFTGPSPPYRRVAAVGYGLVEDMNQDQKRVCPFEKS